MRPTDPLQGDVRRDAEGNRRLLSMPLACWRIDSVWDCETASGDPAFHPTEHDRTITPY